MLRYGVKEPSFLTAQLVSGSRQQVVEDVEAPLLFRLTNSSRLLQQIWSRLSQEQKRHNKSARSNAAASGARDKSLV